jgi:hypothetical protein
MFFSVGCDSHIRHHTKIGLFLSLDAAVASNTEKHCSCKQTLNIHPMGETSPNLVTLIVSVNLSKEFEIRSRFIAAGKL